MEKNCRGGQGLNWAVEPGREREREPVWAYLRQLTKLNTIFIGITFKYL
jgi:hypothetical protein